MSGNEQNERNRTKKRVNPLKMAKYAAIGLTVAGVLLYRSCSTQVAQQSAANQELSAKTDAILDAVYDQVSERVGVSPRDENNGSVELEPNELAMSPLELAIADRDALLTQLQVKAIADIEAASCARAQIYLEQSKSGAIENNTTREQWLLSQLDINGDVLDDWVLQNGLRADAYGIAETRSRTSEPMAIAEALEALYDQRTINCDSDLYASVITIKSFLNEARRVRQLRIEGLQRADSEVVIDVN